jgi:hypothetical protein
LAVFLLLDKRTFKSLPNWEKKPTSSFQQFSSITKHAALRLRSNLSKLWLAQGRGSTHQCTLQAGLCH